MVYADAESWLDLSYGDPQVVVLMHWSHETMGTPSYSERTVLVDPEVMDRDTVVRLSHAALGCLFRRLQRTQFTTEQLCEMTETAEQIRVTIATGLDNVQAHIGIELCGQAGLFAHWVKPLQGDDIPPLMTDLGIRAVLEYRKQRGKSRLRADHFGATYDELLSAADEVFSVLVETKDKAEDSDAA